MARVTCRNCGSELEVAGETLKAGRRSFTCPHCRQSFHVDEVALRPPRRQRAGSRVLLLMSLVGLIIGAAAATFVRMGPIERPSLRVHWICEACGKPSDGPMLAGVRECPHCGRLSCVRHIRYRCRKCRHVFDWARVQSKRIILPARSAAEAKQLDEKASVTLYRPPNGKWSETVPPLACPACKNARLTLFDMLRPGE
jgi:rubrerythrin